CTLCWICTVGPVMRVITSSRISSVAGAMPSVNPVRNRIAPRAENNVVSRIALTTLFSALGAILFLTGFTLGIAPATLLILLLVITRMTGPTVQIQQSVQQFANLLPAYETVKALERELA